MAAPAGNPRKAAGGAAAGDHTGGKIPDMSRLHTPALAGAALVAAVVLAACGHGNKPSNSHPTPASPPPASTAAPAPTAPHTSTPPQKTAGSLAHALAGAGVGVTGVTVQDADSDPNHLLGRPGGYTSRAAFVLPCANKGGEAGSVDAGGAIEVFPDQVGAQRRADYIGGFASTMPELSTEYDTVHGPVLLRVAAGCPPLTAGKIDRALAAVAGG